MLGQAAVAARSAVPRVLVAASGRMGRIRAGLVQASPRLQLCGIVDPISNAQAAELAETYGVRTSVVADLLVRHPSCMVMRESHQPAVSCLSHASLLVLSC